MSKHRRKNNSDSSRDRKRNRQRHPVDFTFWGVSFCFLLSGAAGLIYQMVWMRYLSTVFGTSELAIVTVLVAYMGGLAVGAWTASKFVHRLTRPILVYAILEVSIAVSAMMVPWLLGWAGKLHVAILGGQPLPPADGGAPEVIAYLGLGCVVLFVPTACMGATLPILAKGVIHRTEQIGRRVGWLYSLNTWGAVVGTVTAAFVLIPQFGLWRTSFVGVALNLLVAVLGWYVARRTSAGSHASVRKTRMPEPVNVAPARPAFTFIILAVMLASGSVSFAYEVLWTRLLSHVLGGSLYAFATMLAAFLAGIAIGGLLGARFARGKRESCLWLAGAEISTGILSAVVFYMVGSGRLIDSSMGDPTLTAQAILCAMILLPATICLGATFPLAVQSLTENPSDAGHYAGRVYSWNTVGAIFGAIGAGYLLIHVVGYAGAFKWAICGNLFLGVLVLLVLRPVPRRFAAGAAILAIGFLVVYQPNPPLRLLRRSPLSVLSPGLAEAELIHHAIGQSASVAVLKRQGSYLLRTNGLPEAEIFPKGASALSYTRIRWLPALTKVLHPETESLLVVGYGGGTLLEAIPSGIKSVDVVELEPEVIHANELLADKRAIDPLKDERINIIINDARGALRLTTKRYDAIISQPSHPWTAGASHLYTLEFLDLVKQHLTDEGIFVQWLGANFVDERLFRSFCATMLKVFPHVHVHLIGDNFLFLGSGTSLDARVLNEATVDGSLFRMSEYAKLSFVEDILAVLQLDEAGCRQLGQGHSPITDEENLMATHVFPGTKMVGALNDRETFRRVLGPIHYLNRNMPGLLNKLSGKSIDFRYLGILLQSSSRCVDLREYRRKTLSKTDNIVTAASALIDSQPQEALSVLEKSSALGSENGFLRFLEARARLLVQLRKRANQGPISLEFLQFINGDADLKRAVGKLSDLQRTVVEAEYWTITNQLGHVRSLMPKLHAFDDHRDVSFVTSARLRLHYLLDSADKSVQEQESDARAAMHLLDHLLFLPISQNLPYVSKRIALAQRFSDVDYLAAVGWTLVRKSARVAASAPENHKQVFRNLLGNLLAPYAKKTEDGGIGFSEPVIAKFYQEVLQQAGGAALPEGFRP